MVLGFAFNIFFLYTVVKATVLLYKLLVII